MVINAAKLMQAQASPEPDDDVLSRCVSHTAFGFDQPVLDVRVSC